MSLCWSGGTCVDGKCYCAHGYILSSDNKVCVPPGMVFYKTLVI